MEALRVDGLVKSYGAVRALRGIDLSVQPGEVFGFLGPNGAGKSTAIRIAVDLIRPTAGSVTIFGIDAQHDSIAAREKVGYLQSDPVMPPGMTAAEVIAFYSSVRGTAPDPAYLGSLIERFSLDTSRHVSTLSRGNRQKVGLVVALMHQAPLIILDEPTTGLDPLVQEAVEEVLREVAADGRTVFFSSHILAEVESICSRAAIVRDGLIVDVFDLAEQRRLAARRIEVTFTEAPSDAAFAALPAGVDVTLHTGRRVTLETHDGIDQLVKFLAQFQIADLAIRQPTLEELFVGYYREDEDGARPGAPGADGPTVGTAR